MQVSVLVTTTTTTTTTCQCTVQCIILQCNHTSQIIKNLKHKLLKILSTDKLSVQRRIFSSTYNSMFYMKIVWYSLLNNIRKFEKGKN